VSSVTYLQNSNSSTNICTTCPVSPTCRVPRVQQTSALRVQRHLPAEFRPSPRRWKPTPDVSCPICRRTKCELANQLPDGADGPPVSTASCPGTVPLPQAAIPLQRDKPSLLTQLDLKCQSSCRVESRWKLLTTCCRRVVEVTTCQGQNRQSRSLVWHFNP